MTTIRFDDNRGGLAYPFLPAALAWQITARSLGDEAALAEIFQADTPTLRWVKDDKVLDLHVPGMDTAAFLAHTGLKLSLDKGGYVLSKRLSRIMRPFRYWGFFADSDITIDYNPHLDGRLWDGSGQVSRGFIQRLADTLPLDERHRQELLSSGRFEVTTLHSGGQDKGHGRDSGAAYSVGAMDAAIHQAAANQGVLGSHCNALMLCKAVYGRLPDRLPATLEAVIDGSVKSGLDLRPVKQWNSMALRRMARHGLDNPRRRLPETLLDRLPDWLRQTARDARQPASADSQPVDTGFPPVHTGFPPVHTGFPPVHWLDVLSAAIDRHKAQYWAEVEALAAEACPPLALFEQGRDWLHLGKELRQVYSRVIRQALAAAAADKELPEAVYDEAREASEAYLALWPVAQRPFILLGAAAYLYVQGPEGGAPVRDGVLWQLGARREVGNGRLPGIAQEMMAALRQIGLLNEPAWPTTEPARRNHDEPPGVPVRINGTWLNLLNARRSEPYVRMSDVPPAEREQAKTLVANYAATKFQGMTLTTAVTDDNRVITRTPRGNLFGYVQRDHELAAIRHDQWRIAWATAVDGNVLAVLVPA